MKNITSIRRALFCRHINWTYLSLLRRRKKIESFEELDKFDYEVLWSSFKFFSRISDLDYKSKKGCEYISYCLNKEPIKCSVWWEMIPSIAKRTLQKGVPIFGLDSLEKIEALEGIQSKGASLVGDFKFES